MKRYFGIFIILLLSCAASAQELLKGTLVESGTNDRLSNVFIHDTNSRQLTLADKNGNFEIKTATGHIIVFDSPGYTSDTLYVTDMKPVKIELKPMGEVLEQVDITTTKTTFDPKAEYPEVYNKSKVYVLSPSTWFSKEGKDARRLKHYFETAQQEQYISNVYTTTYVASLVPLKGRELRNFMALYRPSYAYVRSNTGPSLAAYINDSYKKYVALPPDKRTLPSLTEQ